MTENEKQLPTSNIREFVSTGQAARLCSVTPDTVLKWVKSGRLQANRTPGGHYRINRQTLLKIIESGALPTQSEVDNRPFQFCWEFYGKSCGPENNCYECIVYRSRAMRCYEAGQFPVESGHLKVFCKDSCDNCEYYRVVQGQKLNILIITENENSSPNLKSGSKLFEYNLRVVESEYDCSMVVENFRPDYVVLDISLGAKRCNNFIQHLSKDPRIPFVKIIVAADAGELPPECEKTIFAVINNPFTVKDIEELIGLASKESF